MFECVVITFVSVVYFIFGHMIVVSVIYLFCCQKKLLYFISLTEQQCQKLPRKSQKVAVAWKYKRKIRNY